MSALTREDLAGEDLPRGGRVRPPGPTRRQARTGPRENLLLSPKIALAFACAVIFLLIFSATRVGLFVRNDIRPLSVLVLIAVTGAYAATRPKHDLMQVLKSAPVASLALLAIFSTAWSVDPTTTARMSLQFTFTVAVALLIYHTMDFRTFLTALLLVTLFYCANSMVYGGRWVLKGLPLVGAFESKNHMAFIGSASVITSLAAVLDRGMGQRLRLLAAGSLVLGAACLASAQSAGALVATVCGVGVMLAFVALAAVKGVSKVFVVGAALLLVPVGLVAEPLLEREAAAFRTDVLKKDDSLTGRTELWNRANEFIPEHPLVGHGYGAFWRKGNLDAEGLWRSFGVPQRSGFNFHNQYIEISMDLGMLGLLLFSGVALLGGVGLAARGVIRPASQLPFYAAMMASLMIRSPVESVIINQFSLITVLFYMCCMAGIYGRRTVAGAVPDAARRPARRAGHVKRAALPAVDVTAPPVQPAFKRPGIRPARRKPTRRMGMTHRRHPKLVIDE